MIENAKNSKRSKFVRELSLCGSNDHPWPKQNYSKALLQGLFMVTEVVAGTCRNQVAITHSKALLLIKTNNTISVSE
jgi:hypothetical protein